MRPPWHDRFMIAGELPPLTSCKLWVDETYDGQFKVIPKDKSVSITAGLQGGRGPC